MNDEIRQHSPRHSAAVALASSRGPKWAIVCLLALLTIITVIAGCSDSTDPGGGGEDPPSIAFDPPNQGQTIKLSESLLFSATVTPDGPLTVSWLRDGVEVGTASTYLFEPVDVGPDTLRVEASSGTVTRDYYWVVTVTEDPSSIPPAVPNVVVGPGPLPSEVEVSWNRIPSSTFPIQEYVVAYRTDGAVTMDNWNTSAILGTYPVVGGQVGYSVLADSTDGMPPGDTVWFGVRGRDLFDQLSVWGEEHSTEVTWPWWIEGQVYLDTNVPAPVGVIVESLEPHFSDNTDGSGLFQLGPFRNIDQIRMSTTSSNATPGGWYDFVTQPFGPEERNPLIVLMSRFEMDPDYCAPPFNPNGDFLTYLRDMTFTDTNPLDPKRSILHRWEEYPLTVYVPDVQSPTGVSMEQAAMDAIDLWNLHMGDDYFVRVADDAEADLVFVFESYPGLFAGLVELAVPPHANDDQIGRVVPEKMNVIIDIDRASTLTFGTETCLHELGHTLGLLNHSTCTQIGYLMSFTGGGALSREFPIHPDEMNGVRTIRYMTQGVDMKDFQESR